MSKRRRIGDRVWVRRGAGFGMSSGEWAEIIPDTSYKTVAPDYTQRCPYSCGDDGCRQWAVLQAESGSLLFRYVTECEMYDEEPYHKARRQYVKSES